MFRTILAPALVGLTLFSICGLSVNGQEEKKKPELILGKTIGEWIKILRTHENPKYRRAALIALEGANEARASGLPAILDAIEKDKETRVRLDAVNLLGRMGPEVKPSMKALVAALQSDKADEVREAAASYIATKFAESATNYVDALAGALKDKHPGTRIAVAGALRNMGENARPAVPALVEAAGNAKEEPQVRAAAIHVISRLGKEDPKTLPLLLEIAKDMGAPRTLREAAVDGLGRSGSAAPEVGAALATTLTDKSLEMRKASAVALGALGVKAKAAWPTIKLRLLQANESDSSVRNHLIHLTGVLGQTLDEAIPALAKVVVDDTSTENRIAAIQELAELGARAKSAIPALVKVARDDARLVLREAADKAVLQIKTAK